MITQHFQINDVQWFAMIQESALRLWQNRREIPKPKFLPPKNARKIEAFRHFQGGIETIF